MMTICTYPDYEAMSYAGADLLCATIRKNPRAVIVLATGHSPLGVYRLFRQRVLAGEIAIDQVTFVKLDEWLGLSPEDEATCEYFLQTELIGPLAIPEEHYLHIHPQADDPERACAAFQETFDRLGDIDLVVLGIGKNGHLGLNEPGEVLHAATHCPPLESKTKTHAMLTHTQESVTRGMTLGMDGIFAGKQVLLLATGGEKDAVMGYLANDLITTNVPMSLLKLHPHCTCLVNLADYPNLKEILP